MGNKGVRVMGITNEEMENAKAEGLRRRRAYIKKHPREKKKNLAPAGWDDPIEPKKRRRK